MRNGFSSFFFLSPVIGVNACKVDGSGCPGDLWVKPDIYDNHPASSQIRDVRGVYLVCKDTPLVRIHTYGQWKDMAGLRIARSLNSQPYIFVFQRHSIFSL